MSNTYPEFLGCLEMQDTHSGKVAVPMFVAASVWPTLKIV